MGALVGRHFVAGWKKVGTFQIVRDGEARNVPRDVKVGGNVAAYFCTPDLRVVNAVLGNVRPETFLAEARRAVQLRDLVRGACPGEDERLVGQAHAEVPTAETETRAVHGSLAARPLPALDAVYREFFEGILGAEVSDRDVEVVDGILRRRFNPRAR